MSKHTMTKCKDCGLWFYATNDDLCVRCESKLCVQKDCIICKARIEQREIGHKNRIIIITKQHIDEGIPSSACYCPIALALKDEGFEDVTVGTGSASWKGLYFSSFYFTKEMWKFREDFDLGKEVSPFEFELAIE